jgi:hypothetical protein
LRHAPCDAVDTVSCRRCDAVGHASWFPTRELTAPGSPHPVPLSLGLHRTEPSCGCLVRSAASPSQSADELALPRLTTEHQPLLSLPWTPSYLSPSSLPPDFGPERRTAGRPRAGCCAPPWTARRCSNRPVKPTSRPNSVPSSSRSRPPAKTAASGQGFGRRRGPVRPGDYIALIQFFSGFPV